MSDINKKYQDILEGLEKNVKNQNELNLLKSQLSELIVFYTDMINRASYIEENINKVDRNIRRLSRRIDNIEEDIYIESEDEEEEMLEELGEDQMHDNDYEFEITCPYCDYEFLTDSSYKNQNSIRCPKCKRIIQLDWNSEEVCNGECGNCGAHCFEESKEESNAVKEDDADYNVEIEQEEKKNDETDDDDM